jgi:hypothetical protein
MSCPAPDGNNFCGWSDNRILTGWVYPSFFGEVIGFMWNVGQNDFRVDDPLEPCTSDTCFPYPYIDAAMFTYNVDAVSDLVYVSRPYIWSPDKAWLYSFTSSPGFSTLHALVGIAAFSGGGRDYPTLNFGIGDYTAHWNMFGRIEGKDSPASNTWGDYLRVRVYTKDIGDPPETCPLWIGTGYGQWGATTPTSNGIIPLYYIFGADTPGFESSCPLG